MFLQLADEDDNVCGGGGDTPPPPPPSATGCDGIPTPEGNDDDAVAVFLVTRFTTVVFLVFCMAVVVFAVARFLAFVGVGDFAMSSSWP